MCERKRKRPQKQVASGPLQGRQYPITTEVVPGSFLRHRMSFMSKTGFVFEEIYLWHEAGSIAFSDMVEPGEHWENPDTKRRFKSLLSVSGIDDKLVRIKARRATRTELTRFHTERYHDRIVEESQLPKGGDGGELARFGKGGYDIAALSAGGLLAAIEAVHKKEIENAYCLVRPPGHHACADLGMGFCIFNNIAVGAMHARTLGYQRVAIVDYDVHHGNGTQEAFWNDNETLFISVHQAENYPVNTGYVHEVGGPDTLHSTINVPLPPGSGSGAYDYTFSEVVIPALVKFKPDLILVSSGFDASFADPLGHQMLNSLDFRKYTKMMKDAASQLCGGAIIFTHEGGYSKDYVPFCGLAVIEELAGVNSGVEDSYVDECRAKGYQGLQVHQAAVVDTAATLAGLKSIVKGTSEDGLTALEASMAKNISVLLEGITDPSRRRVIIESLLS